MQHFRGILGVQFLIALAAILFCLWNITGEADTFCFSAGCSLYKDFKLFGLSLWWFGAGTFFLLCIPALLGQARLGRILAALFLLADTALLALQTLTVPCLNCLFVAFFFALSYFFFRRADQAQTSRRISMQAPRRSILLLLWALFFVADLGVLAHSEAAVWPILGEREEASVHLYFSPSCPSCKRGIEILSGKVDVAFYPLADNDVDLFRIARMAQMLDTGLSIAEALDKAQEITQVPSDFLATWRPELLTLRLHLLLNKAHVLMAGSEGVPFFEYRGLPADLLAKHTKLSNTRPSLSPYRSTKPHPLDAFLPVDEHLSKQCKGNEPCP